MRYIILIFLLLTVFPVQAAEKENAYDRVTRTKTLRCAYTIYPTYIEKDPNTGVMSGMFYELTQEMGRQLNLKVDWVAEVGTDSMMEGFRTNRYDAVCAGYWASPSRAWASGFTKPLIYMPYNLYVRADGTRFKTFADVNAAGINIATMDGEMSQVVAAEMFPLATQKSVPGLTPATDRFEMLVSGKVDATPMEAEIGAAYMTANPGKIMMMGGQPLQIAGSVILIPPNEFALKQMLDTAIDTMSWTGAIARIADKYEKHPGTIFLPALPYQPE